MVRLFIPFQCWIDSSLRWSQQRQGKKTVFFCTFLWQVYMGFWREGVRVGVCSSDTSIPAHLQWCITCSGRCNCYLAEHRSLDYTLSSPDPQPPEQTSWTTNCNKKQTMGCVQSFRNLCDRQKNTNVRVSLPAVCFVWQIAMIILFGIFIRYDEESDSHWIEHRKKDNISSDIENDFYYRYPSKWHFPPAHLNLYFYYSLM